MSEETEYGDTERVLGRERRQYAENKRRGGDANDDGRAFEQTYTICRIAELAAACIETEAPGGDIWIGEQVDGFVDDLCVREGTRLTYSQIRDVKTLSWGNDSRSLAADFRSQRDFLAGMNRDGRLELVVSRPEVRDALSKGLPGDLKCIATVILHPTGNLPADIDRLPALAASMRTLCSPWNDDATVFNAIVDLLGAWAAMGRKAYLSDLLQRASRTSRQVIAPLGPQYDLPEDVETILNEVEDFEFVVRGTTFVYWYHGGAGTGFAIYPCGTDRWLAFERRLRDAPPTDYIGVLSLMKDT